MKRTLLSDESLVIQYRNVMSRFVSLDEAYARQLVILVIL